jgi:hypothetical protein
MSTDGWTDIKPHKMVSFNHTMHKKMAAGRSIPMQLSKYQLQALFLYVGTEFFQTIVASHFLLTR